MTRPALIFDVDGTLAETEELHRQAFNVTFAQAGLDWQWDEPTYLRLLRVTGGKERMRAWRAETGSGPDDAQIAELHRAKTELYGRLVTNGGLSLRPGVAELIQLWQTNGGRLAVATTTSRANVDSLIQATFGRSALSVFDVVAAGDEVAAKKPAPDVYRLALARLGLSPDQAVAIEDSRNGLVSGLAAGLRVVVAPSRFTSHEDLSAATWLVPDLRPPNLPGVLRQDAHV